MNIPGRRRLAAAPEPARSRLSLVASVQSGDATKNVPQQKLRRLYQEWHPRALATYDTVGECWYPSQFYARSLAKTRWFPALLNDKGEPEEVESGPLADLFARIRDPGTAGRSELAASYGRLQFLNGDGYLTVTQDDDGEAWEYLSVMELKIDPAERADQPQRYRRLRAPGATPEELTEAPDSEFEPLQGDEVRVWRLWRPHPAHSRLADAPIRSVLDLYELLHRLTLAAAGEASSRAAQRGALVVANEISEAYKQRTNDPDDDPESDPFLRALVEALTNGIQNPGTAEALSPLLIRGPAAVQTPGGVVSLKDMVFWMALGPSGAYTEGDMWDKTIQRIGNGLDLPREFLTGVEKANHWCVDDQTEILTADGWRRHDDVSVGDDVLTLNHETGMSEWQPVRDLARFEVDDLEMLSMEGRCHSSLTTMNHRWPTISRITGTRRWRLSETLTEADVIVTGAECADIPREKTYDDAMVELAAWIWTEGSVRHRAGRKHPSVLIHQSHAANPENVASIRTALTGLYGAPTEGPLPSSRRGTLDEQPRWRETTRRGRDTVFALNVAAAAPLVAVAPARIVMRDFIRRLTRAQLELFIATSLRADGSSFQPVIFQKDPKALDGCELAAILLGRSVSRYSAVAVGFTAHLQHLLALHKRNRFGPKAKHKSIVRYTGTIWCPVTANHSWLARRNGKVFYTGNTGWLIDEQGYRQHISPVSERFCNDLASAYLRPAARAEGIADWERVVVGYDPADAILHPDKVQTAFDAHDRLVVSDAYVLEAIGATDEDVPSDEELERRIMVLLKQDPYATEGDEQGGETAPQDGGTGGDTVKGPPTQPVNGNAQTDSGAPGLQTASALQAMKIMGAAQMQVERARELAGQRLIRRAQSCGECQEKLAIKPMLSLVASVLGGDTVRTIIDGHTDESALVSGPGAGFANILRTWGVDGDWPEKLGILVEEHALRTLYQEVPPPLPAGFATVVAKALR